MTSDDVIVSDRGPHREDPGREHGRAEAFRSGEGPQGDPDRDNVRTATRRASQGRVL